MKNVLGDGTVLAKIGGFSQLLILLFSTGKPADPIVPVFFHAEHGVAAAAESLGICIEQFIMKLLQLFCGSASRSKHTGITDQDTDGYVARKASICAKEQRFPLKHKPLLAFATA